MSEAIIIVHPDTMADLLKACGNNPPQRMPYHLCGTPIYANQYHARWCKRWQFPVEPLIEYEPKDERWCRYFGIGCEVDDIGKPAITIGYDWAKHRIGVKA